MTQSAGGNRHEEIFNQGNLEDIFQKRSSWRREGHYIDLVGLHHELNKIAATALSQLAAEKDAEIEKLKSELQRWKCSCCASSEDHDRRIVREVSATYTSPSPALNGQLAIEALESFQVWFKSLPENKTLFTEGKNPQQDALVKLFHLQTSALKSCAKETP